MRTVIHLREEAEKQGPDDAVPRTAMWCRGHTSGNRGPAAGGLEVRTYPPPYREAHSRESTGRDGPEPTPAEITSKHYYWKPAMAYFAAFELAAYRDASAVPAGRLLDLGCGDGTFAWMLRELDQISGILVGVDVDWKRLLRARREPRPHVSACRADGCGAQLGSISPRGRSRSRR